MDDADVMSGAAKLEVMDRSTLIELTAEIASAYLSNNAVRPTDVPELLASLHGALSGLGVAAPAAPVVEKREPAVSIKKSITDDYIISLEDGRKFKSMKRYLSIQGMTPQQYREKWGLPKDYPMVAPNYAKQRSELAKNLGLGRKAAEPAPADPAPLKRRGRAKAA